MATDKKAWLKELNVGDKVAVLQQSFRGRYWALSTIEKITPSGRMNISNGFVINPDGTFRGDVHRTIYQVTDEIIESMEKRKLMEQVNSQFNTVDLENATVEQLQAAHALLKTFPV